MIFAWLIMMINIEWYITTRCTTLFDSRGTNCILNSPKSVWRCGTALILTSQLWKLGFWNFQNYFLCANHLLDTGLFSSCSLRTCLAALHKCAKNALGLHGPSIFRHMNCWTNFFSSGYSFTCLWLPRRLGKLLGMNVNIPPTHPKTTWRSWLDASNVYMKT